MLSQRLLWSAKAATRSLYAKAATEAERVLIIGAAGRDFHNFNTLFRDNRNYEVVGFTAAQIPEIAGRKYPASLAGKLYPDGLDIWDEADLEKIIKSKRVDTAILSYSDLSHHTCMKIAARVQAAGADFQVVSYQKTMLTTPKPCIGITAVRTGGGKSQTTRYVCQALKKMGKTAVVVRHPMPYGDLAAQAVQRFETYEDLVKHKVTIEEREEYEQHIDAGHIVYAGVDYEAILRAAEKEADVVIWDGGNNDTCFFRPDLWICVADSHRAGHEMSYYPGDVNFRCADVIVINKANTAPAGAVEAIKKNAAEVNPDAPVYVCDSEVYVDKPELITGKVCVSVDDGPTLTHGEMAYGAGKVAADKYGCKQLINPRPYAVGSIKATFDKFAHIGNLIPAMGYFPQQIKDLEDTIKKCPVQSVIVATPMNLSGLINIDKPYAVAKYELRDRPGPALSEEIVKAIEAKTA